LLLLWLHQTNDYDGICYFSGYINPMLMPVFLLLWLHQTNDYDGICYFSGYIKQKQKYCHNHWFDVTREVTNTVIVIGLM
jgi:hypothetical protein